MKFLLPYDKQRIAVEIDDRNFAGSLVSKIESYKPGSSEHQLVEASLDHPIGSPKLEELAKGKKNIVIISSDHTRPVPSKIGSAQEFVRCAGIAELGLNSQFADG